MDEKQGAFTFLAQLQQTLDSTLPAPGVVAGRVAALLADASTPHRIPENAFLYEYILPKLHEQLQTIPGIGPKEARLATLSEYHALANQFTSQNAFRRLGHPFSKQLASVEDVLSNWRRPKGKIPPNQAYPDLALRAPCPFKIVFDVKYFRNSSIKSAERALVEGIYETFFYRGLPSAPPRSQSDPGWDYEFGCLLAYDGSEDGNLRSAWESVVSKAEFWHGANLYVLITRGSLPL